ncbi:MAG TPA: ferrous iron transport protein B [Burkholderiales bacterium]|nr:ferrous iron transport protein B [Burkholderiales bacterium]
MKRIALIGMPNTGKSTLFNRLTGASARVGNWPGITVDLMTAKILVGAHMAELVDLPGIYDLHGYSDDEAVVRQFLETTPTDLVLLIVNTVQIERQMTLALQVRALGLPCMLLLNMADEARKLGITVDTEKLSAALAMPVALISAKYGEGQPAALKKIGQALDVPREAGTAKLDALLTPEQIERETAQALHQAVHVPARLPEHLSDKLDRVVLHPAFGLPLFFLCMLLLFQAVFLLGTPLQGAMTWLFDQAKTLVVEPVVSPLPQFVQGFLIDGLWSGLSTVAAFVPLIVLFFLFMAVVEDSGYLSRAAFLTDALMSRLGLDGRSFVMILMGFGCNVPAIMGTRVMRSRPHRLLSMLVIPLSLCSARLQVFLFLIAAMFSPHNAPWVLFSLYLMSFVTAILTALIFKKRYHSTEPFVIELPPYRMPTPMQIWLRGWQEVRHFLHRATKMIIIGVVCVWILTHVPFNAVPAGPDTLAGMLGRLLQPLLAPIGIDVKLTVALMFGFIAKEIVIGAFAVIYGMQGDTLAAHMATQMDWTQAVSFMLFTLIYTPCVSTIAAIRSESKSAKFTLLSVAWPLVLAWMVSFVFYQSARHLLGQ